MAINYVKWTGIIPDNCDWATFRDTGSKRMIGTGGYNNRVSFILAENTSYTDRTANVTFTQDETGDELTFTILQKGKTVVRYTVLYYEDTETPPISIVSVISGETTEPPVQGFDWYVMGDETQTKVTFPYVVTEHISFVKIPEVVVTYNVKFYDGSSLLSEAEYEYGEISTIPSGYESSSWYLMGDSSKSIVDVGNYPITADTSFVLLNVFTVTWLDTETYYTEQVYDGRKANWPNESSYSEPSKSGYMFDGWDFDWENTAITANTSIHPVWDKMTVYLTCNHSTISSSGDSDSDLTTFTYWVASNGGTIIHDNMSLEIVGPDEDERIQFTNVSDSVVSDKNVRTAKASENDVTSEKTYVVRAKTTDYGTLYSENVTITQDAKEESDEYYFASDNGVNAMTVHTIDATDSFTLSAFYSSKNGEYFSGLTFDSDVDWLVPNGKVIRPNPNGIIARIGGNLQSLPVGQEETGRETEILVKQVDDGVVVNSSAMTITQKISQVKITLNFALENATSEAVTFMSFNLQMSDSDRAISFSVPSDINTVAAGDTINFAVQVSSYFNNKTLRESDPIKYYIGTGVIGNTDYISINRLDIISDSSYKLTYEIP